MGDSSQSNAMPGKLYTSMRGTWPLVSETFVLGSFGGSCVVPQASAHGLRLQSLCSGEIVSELILEQGLLSH